MKRLIGLVLVGMLLWLVPSVLAADLKIMTQNQYLGADLSPLFAPDVDFNTAALAVLHQVATNRPAQRIQVLAAEIAAAGPSLVGLQEVFEFKCQNYPTDPGPGLGCDDPSIRDAFVDHLSSILDALPQYTAAAQIENFGLTDVGLVINGHIVMIDVLDRDVILAGPGVAATPAELPCPSGSGPAKPNGCHYSTMLTPSIGPDIIPIKRGFVAVDATVDGGLYRFVTTHLEEKYPTFPASVVQAFQAMELLAALQPSLFEGRRLVVTGDMNSSPLDPVIPSPVGNLPTPYMQFMAAGFTDAWTRRPGNVAGFSCCQPADLSNHNSELYERIDMLFSSDIPDQVKQARVVGATVSDKTPPPGLRKALWPSDHGAVVADLQF
jgi:hypothetical protein